MTVESECEVSQILSHQEFKLSSMRESYPLEEQDNETAIRGVKKSAQFVSY